MPAPEPPEDRHADEDGHSGDGPVESGGDIGFSDSGDLSVESGGDRTNGLTVGIERSVSEELLAAFEHLVPQLSSSSPPPDPAETERIVASDSSILFTVRDERAPGRPIVGTLTLVVFRIPTGVRALIEDVVVDEAARGRGAGALLVQAALEAAAGAGAKTVDLTSRPSREAANRLYERVGFVRRETNLYRMRLT